MDDIISSAVEEICVQGASGIRIGEFWRSLRAVVCSFGFQLSAVVKKVIWRRLVSNPGLQFMSSGSILERKEAYLKSLSLEDLERIDLSIVANEHLRDSFLGLYDLKHAPHFEISQVQRRVLERLAMSRNNGITQSELAKELDIKGTNFFYVVRNLESQQLIVRQSTMVREKEIVNVDNVSKGDHIVNTNLLHLYRYAKNLSVKSQQRIEITRQVCHEMLDASGEAQPSSTLLEGSEDFFKENVSIKDYIPAMQAICERLEAASNKVDVVSGIKSALGYKKSTGHRAWRGISSRLKYAGLIEEFKAEVGGKDVACLRLLKKFDPKYIQSKCVLPCYDGREAGDKVKNGKRGQITDQLVELPLEHRIYDMIEAEGKKGITTLELSKRLGISSKILHKRVLVMCQRFGIVFQSEIHDKTQVYRFWTHSSKYQDPCYCSSDDDNLLLDASAASAASGELVSHGSPFDSGLKDKLLLVDNVYSGKELVPCSGGHVPEVTKYERESEFQMLEVGTTDCDLVVCTAKETIESHAIPSCENPPLSSLSIPKSQRYAHRSLTGFAAQREQRILEKLKKEKFLLKVELHKWLEDVEKDKPSTKDRKTLDRSLKRLQDAGLCESIVVQIPSLSNFNSWRRREAIVHSSANSSMKLPLEIYERHRSFDIQSRRKGSTSLKSHLPAVEVAGLRNMKCASNRIVDKSASKIMMENGFVLSKMVRAKLLHKFLWGYLNSSPYWQCALNASGKHGGDDSSNPAEDCQFVSLNEAINEMPLELFLQVAGVKKYIDNLEEKCKLGLKLSDLPVKQRRCFVDTQATARLSSIVYILYRLRLIQLVNNRSSQDVNLLSYSLELQTYIEEPMPPVLPSASVKIVDDYCKLRHDFLLSDQSSVDRYWETLEYCFAGSDPAYSQKCFPGSVVVEVLQRRSWASVRVMTAEQRMELHKRLTCSDQAKKVPFIECVKIARELNLTLEQVLRFSYDKRQGRLSEYSSYLNPGKTQQCENENNVDAISQKRRRVSLDNLQDQVKNAAGAGEIIGMMASASVKPVSELDSSSGSSQPSLEGGGIESFINQCAFDNLKPNCKKRFSWTYNSDRQLIMLYARHRAMLGARFFRIEWPSLSNLPSQPDTCKRRMAYLNQKSNIRKAVLRLCNLLGERYNNYLGSSDCNVKLKSVDHDETKHSREGFILHGTAQNDLDSSEGPCKFNSQQYRWDDFDDPDVKMALDDVLKYRKLAKIEDAKRGGARLQKGWLDNHSSDTAKVSSEPNNRSNAGRLFKNSATTVPNISDRSTQGKTNNNVYHGNFHKFRGKSIVSQISKSVPLANAIELLKLVFLSNSKAVGVQSCLATALQKFSHSDIYAAFNFLREKNFLVVGHGSRPFVLSRRFFHNVFSSPFPNDSGKRAANFSSWLQKQQQYLIHGGVAIPPDFQCGEMFHLFSLILSGELSISPCLPNEGISEADELKTSESFSSLGAIGNVDVFNNLKRKIDMPNITEKAKKHKLQSKADGDRREKGFPGISVLVNIDTVSRANSFEFLKCDRILGSALENFNLVEEASCFTSLLNKVSEEKPVPKIYLASSFTEGCWDALPTYTNLLLSKAATNETTLSRANFKYVHYVICQAGEQGLSMDEIVGTVNLQGEQVAEAVVDALIAFRLAVKVNAFDSVRILDSSYASKYFFNVLGNDKIQKEGYNVQSFTRPIDITSDALKRVFPEQHEDVYVSNIDPTVGLSGGNNAVDVDSCDNSSDSHVKAQPCGKSATVQVPQTDIFQVQENEVSSPGNLIDEKAGVVRPIFPWINGDGNTNTVVYRGLSRRIIGFIMQNPGILEEDIINKMDVLNPQSCRRLLDTLVLDNHIMVRRIHEPVGVSSPAILQRHFPCKLRRPALNLKKHYFANPMSTRML